MTQGADHPLDRLAGHPVHRDSGCGTKRERTGKRRRLAPRLHPHLQDPGRIPFHQRPDRMHPEDQLSLGHASSVAPRTLYRRLDSRPRRSDRPRTAGFAMTALSTTVLLSHGFEINAALVEVHARHANPNPIAKPERTSRALSAQPMSNRIEVEVVGPQCADVNETLDEHVIEGDEDSEGGDTGDGRVELLAQLLEHELALEPRDRVARRVIGAAFGHRAVIADRRPETTRRPAGNRRDGRAAARGESRGARRHRDSAGSER